MTFRILAVLFCTACTVIAGDVFRYEVIDETKTDKLHFEHAYDFTIQDFPDSSSPRLAFSKGYRIYGCTQDSFTYTNEQCEVGVSRERVKKLIAAMREIPLQKLQPKQQRGEEAEWSQGRLELDGTNHTITARLNQPERAKLHGLILAFLDEVAPKATRKTTSRTIEGDHVPARSVTIEALLRAPEKFDGKRVQLVGYYHGEFEGSNFGPSKKADYKESVWLGGDSTLAAPATGKRPNDAFITVEGTFNNGPRGHMGLWPGEVDRVTRIKKTKR